MVQLDVYWSRPQIITLFVPVKISSSLRLRCYDLFYCYFFVLVLLCSKCRLFFRDMGGKPTEIVVNEMKEHS